MGYSFLEFMKRTGIFIVCAQCFLHFSAGRQYEKYLKLLIGMMILAQFAIPFGALFSGKETKQLWEETERFQKELEERAGEVVWEFEEEDAAVRALEEEIAGKLESAAREYGYVVKDVTMRDDPPGAEIVIRRSEKKEGRIEVEKIRVGSPGEAEKAREEFLQHQEEMKQVFGSVLNTDEAYIIIREE